MEAQNTTIYQNSNIQKKSKRCSLLGLGIHTWETKKTWSHRNPLSYEVFDENFGIAYGTGHISRKDQHAMLRRSKEMLSMRSVSDLTDDDCKFLDRRRPWNAHQTESLLDYFTSLKYSYSSFLPRKDRNVNLVVSDCERGRVSDIARSHSIWLDPVDAPKELYKYRLRINNCITWGYDNDFIPVMMTLTVFHRWHGCRQLIKVLGKAWSSMFSGRRWRSIVERVGLQGYIRRLEITINDGSLNHKTGEVGYNSGWHPHFHAIWFVSRNNLKILSDMEDELKERWVCFVRKHFKEEFGEDIDESYLPSFIKHGLCFSREAGKDDIRELLQVDSSVYLSKVMGYDFPYVYGGDSELTATSIKSSKIPFDLLSEVTASNVDLWCEYAIATKGVPAFTFSRGLKDKVESYFRENPTARNAFSERPKEKLVAVIHEDVYRFLNRNALYPTLLKIIPGGYDVLCAWFRKIYTRLGVPELCDCLGALPRLPDSDEISRREPKIRGSGSQFARMKIGGWKLLEENRLGDWNI